MKVHVTAERLGVKKHGRKHLSNKLVGYGIDVS